MTVIAGTSSSYGVLSTLIANSANVHQQLDTLTEQASSGLISQTYAGLGGGAGTALNLSPQLDALQTYKSNIDQALGTMQVTQAAMTQLQQIASTFVAFMPNLNGLNPSEVDSVAANARNALSQVANLLDTKNGNTYVFGGEDSGNPPVPAPDQIQSSAFFTTIQTDVSGLSISTPGDTQAAALANSPISATPSKPPVVQTGEGTTVQIGLLANANSVAKSSGPTTTQSYMLDLMRALATLGSMSSSQVSNPNFAGLVQDTSATLKDVVGAMATDAGVLGTTQANLTDTQTQLTATSTALSGQVAAVQEVDMATTLSHLTGMQTQLQASYRLISAATSMSLVNFLPAGA